MKITKEQIDAWKKEHGEVRKIGIKSKWQGIESVEDEIYLRELENQEFAMCISMYGKKEIFKGNEFALRSCYLGGSDVVDKFLKDATYKGISKERKIYRTAVQAAGDLVDFLEYESETLV